MEINDILEFSGRTFEDVEIHELLFLEEEDF